MEDKELEANDTEERASTKTKDMDPIDYLALLMEQEHR